jgi:hypothetical protein
VYKLDFVPEMAEEDHDPKTMHGELDFRAVIEIPRSLIRRRNNKPDRHAQKQQESISYLELNVHACDAWCTRSFQIKLPGGSEPPTKSKKDQPGGKSEPTEYTFKWLTNVAGRRYNQLFRPHGRVRNRESAYGGTEGQLTPQAAWAQMPEGFDRLDEIQNLVLEVDGETPLRSMVRDGDDVWIMFQNRTPSRVITAGGKLDERGKRVKPNLRTLQREQYNIDQARAWLKRTCRADQEKIQLRIAAKFRRMQQDGGRSIRDIFVAFDEDGGGVFSFFFSFFFFPLFFNNEFFFEPLPSLSVSSSLSLSLSHTTTIISLKAQSITRSCETVLTLWESSSTITSSNECSASGTRVVMVRLILMSLLSCLKRLS